MTKKSTVDAETTGNIITLYKAFGSLTGNRRTILHAMLRDVVNSGKLKRGFDTRTSDAMGVTRVRIGQQREAIIGKLRQGFRRGW